MKKLILVISLLMLTSGCTAIWKDDMLAVSLFAGAVAGEIDPETGTGTWIRVGEYKASGIEILKEGDDYIINFDTLESKTEFDKMKFFLEKGIELGKGTLVP